MQSATHSVRYLSKDPIRVSPLKFPAWGEMLDVYYLDGCWSMSVRMFFNYRMQDNFNSGSAAVIQSSDLDRSPGNLLETHSVSLRMSACSSRNFLELIVLSKIRHTTIHGGEACVIGLRYVDIDVFV